MFGHLYGTHSEIDKVWSFVTLLAIKTNFSETAK